jgi:hypothetical protein
MLFAIAFVACDRKPAGGSTGGNNASSDGGKKTVAFSQMENNVPRDISVVGFDDIAFSSLIEPALTTVNLPLGELGRLAVEALMTTLSSPTQHGIELPIPTQLVIRNSTAAARSGKV